MSVFNEEFYKDEHETLGEALAERKDQNMITIPAALLTNVK